MRKSRPADPVPPYLATAHRRWWRQPLSRRRFLKGAGALASGLLLPWLPTGVEATRRQPDHDNATAPWITIAAVQIRLFPPTGDGPDAEAIHARAYLQQAMALPRFPAAEQDFLLQGTVWLNELAQTTHAARFEHLGATQQEALLQRIVRSPAGENWLSLLLLYIFEALLTHPVYGGNPDGIGWAWLDHDPGFPLPTAATTFDRILVK